MKTGNISPAQKSRVGTDEVATLRRLVLRRRRLRLIIRRVLPLASSALVDSLAVDYTSV